MTVKRSLARGSSLVAVIALIVGACSSGGTASKAPASAATSNAPSASTAPGASASAAAGAAAFVPDPTLLAAAKGEGKLTTIALPKANWCNYAKVMAGFTAKTGIPINDLNPDGSSQQEVDAIKANKGSKGDAAPDVIDVGLGFGPTAKADGLLAPYKVSVWDSIPATAKDADGSWYGDYYGVLAFETNTDVQPVVPADWSDLLKPIYKGQVALTGNPVKSNQAISGVWAAAFANGGGADNVQPGLDFFKQLNDKGNFVPVIATKTTVAAGETPVRITWTYNGLGDKDSLAGKTNITVAVPTTGRFGGMYIQAISAYAPHPNAAKLWMEYIYSDEGQSIWLSGYCNPIRYDDMAKRGAIPADLQAKLPDTKGAFLPTLDQITKATTEIAKGWPTTVGVVVPD
ncbi:MAG: ABC transporter substrate-binding protein [Chloroflexota bacterium]|nr:ABC transporter substrate-binding protein [Chloroflexota bacterium]